MLQPSTVYRKSFGYDCNNKGCSGSARDQAGESGGRAMRQSKAPALIARIVFDIDICKGLPETVPATGSRRKSRDHRRPRSGRILPPCDIGSSSTRLRLGFLRRTRVHHHKLGWTRFRTTLPPQDDDPSLSSCHHLSGGAQGPDPVQALLQAGPPDAVQPLLAAAGTWCLVAADAGRAVLRRIAAKRANVVLSNIFIS